MHNGGQAFLRRHAKLSFWTIVLGWVLFGIYVTWQQYRLWEAGELTRLLLPEYQDNYFYFYTATRIIGPYFLSFVMALVTMKIMQWQNNRFGGKFFEAEEPYLMGISMFVVAYPACLVYLVLLLVVYLLLHIATLLRGAKNARLSLYNLWSPIGLATFLLFQYWLIDTPIWFLLKI